MACPSHPQNTTYKSTLTLKINFDHTSHQLPSGLFYYSLTQLIQWSLTWQQTWTQVNIFPRSQTRVAKAGSHSVNAPCVKPSGASTSKQTRADRKQTESSMTTTGPLWMPVAKNTCSKLFKLTLYARVVKGRRVIVVISIYIFIYFSAKQQPVCHKSLTLWRVYIPLFSFITPLANNTPSQLQPLSSCVVLFDSKSDLLLPSAFCEEFQKWVD